jgi:hypothetical protein
MFIHFPKSGDISFQYRTRNKLMNCIWINIGWIQTDEEFYELLLYIIYTISRLSCIMRLKYLENRLQNKYKKQLNFHKIKSKTVIYFFQSNLS